MMQNSPYRDYKPMAVTISLKQYQFIKETKMSPSKLLQQAIEELMFNTSANDIKGIIRFQKEKAQQLLNTVLQQKEFIEKNGLLTKYLQESK